MTRHHVIVVFRLLVGAAPLAACGTNLQPPSSARRAAPSRWSPPGPSAPPWSSSRAWATTRRPGTAAPALRPRRRATLATSWRSCAPSCAPGVTRRPSCWSAERSRASEVAQAILALFAAVHE